MEDDTIVSQENVCICKVCRHGLAIECIDVKCQCCGKASHSMILDGIEGFMPAQGAKSHNEHESAEVVDVRH